MVKHLKKSQAATLAKLDAARQAAEVAVFGFAVSPLTRFNDCLRAASDDVKAAYTRAYDELAAFETEMIRQGRAWRSTFGTVFYH